MARVYVGSGGGGGDAGGGHALRPELSRLREQVAALESEREMRVKLEKLLEVQTVQVDLQKELRVKTESLLRVEQQTTSQLTQQLDELRMSSGTAALTESMRNVEKRFAAAQERIHVLEQQLAEATARETSDRAEAQLTVQVEEQERIIKNLRAQLEGKGGAREPPEGEMVRLQLLLQSKDRNIDEMTQAVRTAQNESAELQTQCDVLRHQIGILKKEVGERTDENERSLNTERQLRADVFQLQATVERLTAQHSEEVKRASVLAETAALAEEKQRRISQLEQQLSEEQTTSRRERDQLAAECEFRTQGKEQTIRHQTSTIESLNRELKERQAEIDKLPKLGAADVADGNAAGDRDRDKGGVALPPLHGASPRAAGYDIQGQRSLESLHRQLRSKDAKIAKQTERLQTLTEMLEKRDQQLEELSTARRDREQMRQKVADMEEVMRAQPRVATHAEAERRLIEQEQRLLENERRAKDLDEALQQESMDKESATRDLVVLRGHLAEMESSSASLQQEKERLERELAENRRQLDARLEELRRAHQAKAAAEAATQRSEVEAVAIGSTLPAMQKKLQRLEELDKTLCRDIAVHLQERENKIDTLTSTVTLLRSTVDELRRGQQLPPASWSPVPPASIPNLGQGTLHPPTSPTVPTTTPAATVETTIVVPPTLGPDAPELQSAMRPASKKNSLGGSSSGHGASDSFGDASTAPAQEQLPSQAHPQAPQVQPSGHVEHMPPEETSPKSSSRSARPAAEQDEATSHPRLLRSETRENLAPKTLLGMKEDHLLYKMEKVVDGRKVLVAFYNTTTTADILTYSHNIRVVVACLPSLDVLLTQDLHENALETICARRDKRHLMSAIREADLVRELADCLVLQHAGQEITGIEFTGED